MYGLTLSADGLQLLEAASWTAAQVDSDPVLDHVGPARLPDVGDSAERGDSWCTQGWIHRKHALHGGKSSGLFRKCCSPQICRSNCMCKLTAGRRTEGKLAQGQGISSNLMRQSDHRAMFHQRLLSAQVPPLGDMAVSVSPRRTSSNGKGCSSTGRSLPSSNATTYMHTTEGCSAVT